MPVLHAIDTERSTRVPGVGGCAESRKATPEDEVHGFAPPLNGRSAAGKLLRAEAKGGTGGRRRDVAGVSDRAGRSVDRSARPGPPGSFSSASLAKSVHPEGRRAATSVGDRGAGGQDRPTGRGHHPQCDLRGRLSGLFVWVSTGTQPASSAGRALGGAHPEARELRS